MSVAADLKPSALLGTCTLAELFDEVKPYDEYASSKPPKPRWAITCNDGILHENLKDPRKSDRRPVAEIGHYLTGRAGHGGEACVADRHLSACAVPNRRVAEAIRDSTIHVEWDLFHFELIVFPERSCLYVQYGQIIGSRLLAFVPTDSIPDHWKPGTLEQPMPKRAASPQPESPNGDIVLSSKRIAPEVEEVLRAARIDGHRLYLPSPWKGQKFMDRKLYEAVLAVLAPLGGQWKRKEAAIVFDGDPAEALASVLEAGKVPEKNPYEFFPTPPDTADYMVELAEVEEDMAVLEPSAGDGAIYDALVRVQPLFGRAILLDVDPKRVDALRQRHLYVHQADFLTWQDPDHANGFDRVVMNPPFGGYIEHVRHAWGLLRPGGKLVSVVPSSVSFATDRKTTTFRAFVDEHGYVEPLPEGTFEPHTAVNACLVVLDKPSA